MQGFACTVKSKRSCEKNWRFCVIAALPCRQIHYIFYVHYQIETFSFSFSPTPLGGVQQKEKNTEDNCKYPVQEVGLTGYQKSEKSDIA